MAEIHKDMTIDEILGAYPGKSQKLAQVLTNAGLQCLGCSASTWETLEAGIFSHGLQQEDLDHVLNKLNDVLKETMDLTSITLTKKAAKKFQEIAKEDDKEGWALRFGDQAAGCSGFEYILDFSKQPKKNDAVYYSEGIEIHVDKTALSRLIGCTIDYVDGLSAGGFKISNPNARGSCGCGSSHSYG